jgi:hypothetical protein
LRLLDRLCDFSWVDGGGAMGGAIGQRPEDREERGSELPKTSIKVPRGSGQPRERAPAQGLDELAIEDTMGVEHGDRIPGTARWRTSSEDVGGLVHSVVRRPRTTVRPSSANIGICWVFRVAQRMQQPRFMELKVFAPQELDAVLRALRNVALANDRFTDAERALVEGVAHVHEVEIDADELEPISFDEVARVVVDPHRRKRAVQLAIVTALVEGTPSDATEKAVREFASALGLDEEGLDVLYEVTHGRALLARIDMFRRFTRFLRNAKGFPGILKFALPLFGFGAGDERLAARYRALGDCARGTMGRALYDHFVENEFEFPGEPGGIPLVFHDVGHILSGYGTDPQGEIQQAAFQAGFARRDGFTFLLFGILQFHVGMRITPVAKGYYGLFDVPLVLTALHRGASCKVDLSEDYDIFADKDRPLDEVRRELGILPLSSVAQAS